MLRLHAPPCSSCLRASPLGLRNDALIECGVRPASAASTVELSTQPLAQAVPQAPSDDIATGVVCPHGLRGLWATASGRSGALSQAVAAALGHGSFTMTQRHYVEPGTIEGTRTEQLVKLLDLSGAQPVSRGADATAEQLLTSLPPETLIELVELVNAGRLPKAKKPD